MKKITMLFMFLWTVWGFAQAKRYTFSQTVGTYVEIADVNGTILGNSNSDAQYFINPAAPLGGLTSTGTGFDIGFNFVFNGDTYNRFAVANDGWISLGYGANANSAAIDMTIPDPLQPLSSVTTSVADLSSARIAALTNDLVAQTGSSLIYKLDGTAPNRVLTVQWKNYKKKTGGDGDSFNFQIRLKETSNIVEFDYGTFVCNANSLNYQVGLRGAPGSTLSNFSNVTSTTGWVNPISGVNATDSMLLNNTYNPAAGTTYTWTPPTCGSPRVLATNNINSNSASITWGAYIPAPSAYEYVVSTSSTAPTGAGIATNTASANLSGLTAATTYNVFVRGNCSGVYTSWVMLGSFTTCTELTTIFETFNYTRLPINNSPNPNTYFMPSCWSALGSSSGASIGVVAGSSGTPASTSNKLLLNLTPVTNQYACAVLPSVSNLQSGTNQLRFKAGSNLSTGISVQVGYFTDAAGTAFVQIDNGLFPLNDSMQEKVLVVPAIANVKNLVIRTTSIGSSNTVVYLEDVSWEPISNCPNVSNLTYSMPTSNSFKVKWVKGSTEAQWQYVYALASVATDPNNLTASPVPGSLPEVVIGGLQANTAYNVWIRSICPTTGYSSWVGPLAVTTPCDGVATLYENFDAYSTGLPSCWTKVGTTGSVGVTTLSTPGLPSPPLSSLNKLWINGNTSAAVVALPGLTSLKTPNYQMRINLAWSANGTKPQTSFEIGYVTDLTDPTTFTPITSYTCAASNVFEYKPAITLGTIPDAANYLAFRANGSSYFVDDLVWEPVPIGCPNLVKDISAVGVLNGTATLQWHPGNDETKWQYVLGSSTDSNPNLFTPQNFASIDVNGLQFPGGFVKGTVSGLSSGSIYKIWVRAVCDDTHPGSFAGPYIINTTCSPVDYFSENFDLLPSGQKLPTCWVDAAGTSGNTIIGTPTPAQYKAPSGSFILSLQGNTASPKAVISMPAISNYNDGTHRLTFMYRSSQDGTKLEVGFMKNPSDASTFTLISTLTGSAGDFVPGVVNVPANFPGATPILAFRGTSVSIDNVKWDVTPNCANVQNLVLNTSTSNSIDMSWNPSTDGETNWEYVVGQITDNDPPAVNPVAVTDTSAHITSITTIAGGTTSLQPSTTYRIWVRSKCSDIVAGTYSSGNYVGPLTVTTTCAEVSSFYEDFDEIKTPAMPSCWQHVGTQGVGITEYPGIQILLAEPGYNNRLQLTCTTPAQKPVVSMPAVTLTSFADHVLKFRMLTAHNVVNNQLVKVDHSTLEVGFLTNPADPNSFVVKKILGPPNDYPSALAILDKNDFGDVPLSSVLAFRNPGIDGDRVKIYIDKVSWELAPTAPPACVVTTVTKDATCGNYENTISWAAVQGADGYKISLGTAPGVYDISSNVDLDNGLKTTFRGKNNTTYYYKVTAYNHFGDNACAEQSFTTAATNCFCTSNPTSMDGTGITNVVLSGRYFYLPATPLYQDYTNTIVNVPKVGNLAMELVFNTGGKTYNTGVWVDFNDNYQYEDSEKMNAAMTQDGLTDVSFSMPANAPLGVHFMRFATKFGADADPCYNGALGETLDFKINVVNAVGNDESATATLLTVGTSFASNAIDGTNLNATGSFTTDTPNCGNYAGADVWYKAIVPTTGNITFEVNSVPGGITNTAATLYSVDPVTGLKLIACDDSSSTAGDDQPKIVATQRVPGETLYFRVWDYENTAYGSFKVSAYDDTPLGIEKFDSTQLSVYPNPIRDILNVSFDGNIDNVAVVNMLGQVVISQSINSNRGSIDMSDLSSGTYLLRVTADNETKTIKVIKQ